MNKTNSTVQVGDIFLMSWGYDQTNVNFFQVTRISQKGIFVREIGYRGVPGTDGFMCQKVVAVKDGFTDRSQWCNPKGQSFGGNVETFRKVGYTNGKACFSVGGRYWAFMWDGKPTYNSWYA